MTTGALHFRIICRHCGMAAGAIRRGFRRTCRAAEGVAEVGLDWLGRAVLVVALVGCYLVVSHFLGLAGLHFLHDVLRCDDDDR